MRIVRGRTVEMFAEKFKISQDEVVNWMNEYINEPEKFPGIIAAGLMEETESERAESIKRYVSSEIEI